MPRAAVESKTKTRPQIFAGASSFSVAKVETLEQLVGHTIAEMEREFILATLNCCFGNRTYAAKVLDISIRSLRNKIHAYTARGINVPKPG